MAIPPYREILYSSDELSQPHKIFFQKNQKEN